MHNAKLDNATLDGGDFRHAVLDGSSLIGANISEVELSGASIRHADLAAACLAESRLVNVDFSGSSFGATILAGATIDNCIFTCLSALSLPFIEAHLGRNILELHGKVATFSAPPVVITGMPKRIALLDSVVIVGECMAPRSETGFDPLRELKSLCERALG